MNAAELGMEEGGVVTGKTAGTYPHGGQSWHVVPHVFGFAIERLRIAPLSMSKRVSTGHSD